MGVKNEQDKKDNHTDCMIVCIGMVMIYSAYTGNQAIEYQTISVHQIDKKGLMDVKPYILGRLDGQKLDVSDYKKGLLNTTPLSMNEHLYLDKDKDNNCRLYLSRMQGENNKVISAYAMSAVYLDAGVSRLSHCGILKLFSLSELDTSKIKPQLQPSKSCDVKDIGVKKDFNRHPLKRAENSIIKSKK